MSIDLRDGRYYKAFWHFEFDAPRRGNVLGAIYSDDPERKEWHINYRFRYYLDDKLGNDSEDEKTWYAGTAIGPETEVFEKTIQAFRDLSSVMGSTLNVSVVESDRSTVQVDILMGMPGMNTCSIFGGIQPGSSAEN